MRSSPPTLAAAGAGPRSKWTALSSATLPAPARSALKVEQDNGTDVAGTTVLPLVTATNAGLLPTTGRICPDPSTGTAGQVCTVNAAEDGYELAGGRRRRLD